ncbi:hypothetical protein PIB30_057172 [Stylosanthes scabra]|uniref:Uncharacterized protein n=1 Tax=Stylosanthes scabra TaxID=79078 RepID=A0ABU6ZIA3_9FABA|nr:hypothetical protein [Stylosanthes scabra]
MTALPVKQSKIGATWVLRCGVWPYAIGIKQRKTLEQGAAVEGRLLEWRLDSFQSSNREELLTYTNSGCRNLNDESPRKISYNGRKHDSKVYVTDLGEQFLSL